MNMQSLQLALENGFAWTWRTSWHATVLIALVFGIQFMFKRRLAARWRYALSLLILLRLALPVVPASTFSVFNLGNRFQLPRQVSAPVAGAPAVEEKDLVRDSSRRLLPIVGVRSQAVGGDVAGRYGSELVRDSSRRLLRIVDGISGIGGRLASTPALPLVWMVGCVGMLFLVARQQWRLVGQLRTQEPLRDARLLRLLEECKAGLGIKRTIMIYSAPGCNTPALFGHWRPRLLLPGDVLERLEDRELRFVFLHELTHLTRRDVLVNWAVIFFRTLHWFNPAVWLAMKRLRADQELACDAAVMARLAAEERRHYGHTLIKLLEEFSVSPVCPGLVPFITNKQIIKSRIAMISQFKPTGRLALAGSIALLLALGGFTFTRAAEETVNLPTPDAAPRVTTPPAPSTPPMPDAAPTVATPPTPATPPETPGKEGNVAPPTPQLANNTMPLPEQELKQQMEASARALNAMEEKFDELTAQVRRRQEQLGDLRRKLDIPNEVAEGNAVSNMDAETMRHLRELLANSESQYAQQQELLNQLKSLTRDTLRNALPTAAPDEILTQLLKDAMAMETRLVTLRSDMGDQNPELVRALKLRDELDKQIDARLKGILQGMEVRVKSLKASVDELKEKIAEAKKDDSQSLDRYQPYFQAKRDMENLQKTRDALMSRLNQTKIDIDLRGAGR